MRWVLEANLNAALNGRWSEGGRSRREGRNALNGIYRVRRISEQVLSYGPIILQIYAHERYFFSLWDALHPLQAKCAPDFLYLYILYLK